VDALARLSASVTDCKARLNAGRDAAVLLLGELLDGCTMFTVEVDRPVSRPTVEPIIVEEMPTPTLPAPVKETPAVQETAQQASPIVGPTVEELAVCGGEPIPDETAQEPTSRAVGVKEYRRLITDLSAATDRLCASSPTEVDESAAWIKRILTDISGVDCPRATQRDRERLAAEARRAADAIDRFGIANAA
jgi:hypothetical protein